MCMEKEHSFQSNPTDNYERTKDSFDGRVCGTLQSDHLVVPVFDTRHFEEWICPICEMKVGEEEDSDETILETFKKHTISEENVSETE